MGFFDKGFDPIKEAQKTAAAAGKGIASVAEQASNAAQSAVEQTGQAIGDIAGKAKGAVQSIGDAIKDVPEPKSFKYNTEFADERNVDGSPQSQRLAPEHMAKMLGDVAEGAANAASVAAAGAQGAVAAIAGKAGEIADGVRQGVENARAKEPDEYELTVIEYNQTYTDLESGGIELYQSRLRSIDLLDLVTDLVNSIANTPKSFVEDIEECHTKSEASKSRRPSPAKSWTRHGNRQPALAPASRQVWPLPASPHPPPCGLPQLSVPPPRAPRSLRYRALPRQMRRWPGSAEAHWPPEAAEWPVAPLS